MAILGEEELASKLGELEGWSGDSTAITKSFEFASFMEGIAFVGRIAEIAEERNHHPDIDIRWRTVRLTLSTHSEGGVTERDLELARAIEAVAVRQDLGGDTD